MPQVGVLLDAKMSFIETYKAKDLAFDLARQIKEPIMRHCH
jgi:hypothetical protein